MITLRSKTHLNPLWELIYHKSSLFESLVDWELDFHKNQSLLLYGKGKISTIRKERISLIKKNPILAYNSIRGEKHEQKHKIKKKKRWRGGIGSWHWYKNLDPLQYIIGEMLREKRTSKERKCQSCGFHYSFLSQHFTYYRGSTSHKEFGNETQSLKICFRCPNIATSRSRTFFIRKLAHQV